MIATRKVVTIYLPPAQSQPALFINDDGLDFFHQKLAVKLDGEFNSHFWSKLVLQLSHSEPSVRHAVSAISAIYQDVELSVKDPAGHMGSSPGAQKAWNCAIRSLSERIESKPNSNLVPLVCSLLFTCIEFFRGNVESSLLHVQSGFNILTSVRTDGASISSPDTEVEPEDLRAIEEHLVPMFSRLNLHCSVAGRLTPPMHNSKAGEGFPHEDLLDARNQLFEVSDACMRFILSVQPRVEAFELDIEDFVEQVKLQTRLDGWRNQLKELIERMRASGKPAKQHSIHLLLLHYKVIYIWIRVCSSAGEMAPDSYHADFEEIAYHAERIASTDDGFSAPDLLSFDFSTMGPLYYAALKCRYPTTRRRALEMLRFAPRRDGLWNSHHAYATAKRIIEVEESHLDERGLPLESSRVHGLPLPNDSSRIYKVGVPQPDLWRFAPSPVCPGTLEIEFHTKPWGPLGEWRITTEHINV
jgi:hypothetical protein